MLQDVWRTYRLSPMSCRLRVVIRYLSCPFRSVLREFPVSGRILDVGCGDGLLLYLLNCESIHGTRTCIGIDVAQNKIVNAKKLQVDNVEFRHADIADMPSESFDCVSIMDVLYLLPSASWENFLRHCVRVIRGDGLLIVKENIDQPKWKVIIGYMQELISIYVTCMTKGDHPHFETLDFYRDSIQAGGADVFHSKRLDAGFPYPHVLLLARKR